MAEEEILGSGGEAEEDTAEPQGTTTLTAEEGGDKDDVKATDDGGEAKTADDTDDTSKDGIADTDKDGAPSEYADFTLPKGTEIDKEVLGEFHGVLKDIGATQEKAQAMVDLYMKNMGKAFANQEKQWADIQAKWSETAENDEEYGKGAYDKSMVVARSAMREIGGPSLAKALEETGMGNHPEFIRFFYRVGKAIGEDNFSFGKAHAPGQKSTAERLFPNQGKEAA